MAPFRIPFTSKRPTPAVVDITTDENAKPAPGSPYKPSLALGTKERREEPNEFKLSSVGDDGQYLPLVADTMEPSPTEKKSFWHKSTTTANAPTHRNALGETEPFSISRESFDSYRRSFVGGLSRIGSGNC
ncbi:hypothetical protein LTR64_006905 [Lithohypha guttulata]|uniref:uncharacterized protein n=1 Tax=Lithohypha guttulata TaxID=1690604 RepID=UPI002DE0C162|nr:hypothetical protein LTR51_004537 [Lithohypha guttulata]